MNTQIRQFKYQNLNQRQRMIVFGLVFGVIGVAFVFITNAATTSTISGFVFKDTNRNGIMDSGEEPMAGQSIYLLDETGQNYVSSVGSDSTGHYTFSGLTDGNYQIEYGPEEWWAIRAYWAPTTTGSVFPKKNITLSGQANFNFGWRQIVRSYDPNAPITTFVAPTT